MVGWCVVWCEKAPHFTERSGCGSFAGVHCSLTYTLVTGDVNNWALMNEGKLGIGNLKGSLID